MSLPICYHEFLIWSLRRKNSKDHFIPQFVMSGYTSFAGIFNVDIDPVISLQENLLERGLLLPCPLRSLAPACLWSLGIAWLGSRHSDMHHPCAR